jgi:hypothetical protein
VNPTYGGLNTTLATMIEKINAAGAAVDGTLGPVFFTVGVLLLAFACIKTMWQRDLAPLAQFVVSYILLMTIITLSAGWMPLTQGYMAGMGSYGARIAGLQVEELSPATVMMRGLEIADKMYTENVSWMRTIFGTTEDNVANIVMLLVCIITIGMSVFMAIFLMVFFVLMKLASIVALVFLVFMLFDWSRFMAAPGVARILAYGVQMLVMSIIAGLMFTTLDALELSDRLQAGEAIATLVIVSFFAFLFFNTTNLAREQISGMPVLSLNEPGNALGKGALMAAGALGGMSLSAIAWGGRNLRVSGTASAPHGMTFSGSAGSGGGSGGGAGAITGAPAAAFRMLDKPPIDATWTEAKDLAPKAAQRMLGQTQRALPDHSPKSLPAPPRQLPPPSRFS